MVACDWLPSNAQPLPHCKKKQTMAFPITKETAKWECISVIQKSVPTLKVKQNLTDNM